MTLTPTVTKILATLTVIGDLLILFFLIFLAYKLFFHKKVKLAKYVRNNSLFFAFVVALIATAGSLFYSEIAGYTPCRLCWFQRIFMYPQVLLLGIALFKKDKKIAHYIMPMSILGGIISIYHYTIQRLEYISSCGSSGVSCSSKYFFSYGYITIPMMALTAFVLIIIFAYIWNQKDKESS